MSNNLNENTNRIIEEKIKQDLQNDDSSHKISFNQNKITKLENWKNNIPDELNRLSWMENYEYEVIARPINKLKYYFSKFNFYKKYDLSHLESGNPISLVFLLIDDFLYEISLDEISKFLLGSNSSNGFLVIEDIKLYSYEFFFDQEYFDKNNKNIRTIFISINSKLTNQPKEYIKFVEDIIRE